MTNKHLDTIQLGQYVLVRTYSAGVFAGILHYKEGDEVEMHDARRIWYWAGAASLSQLAEEGIKKPNDCKFPTPVKQIILQNVIEIATMTPNARLSIESVPVWSAKEDEE